MEEIWMSERRHYPRLRKKTSVTVKVKSAPDARDLEGESYPCYTVNISLDGLLLSVDYNIPVGSFLELYIQSEKYWHAGTVMWTSEVLKDDRKQQKAYFVGIEFDSATGSRSDAWRTAMFKMQGDEDKES
jgi:hypothetical protein